MKAPFGSTVLGTLMAIGMTTAAAAATAPSTAVAPDATAPVLAVVHRYGFDLKLGRAVITVRWLAANILRVHYLPDAHAGPRTAVLQHDAPFGLYQPHVRDDAGVLVQSSPAMRVTGRAGRLEIDSASGQRLLTLDDLRALTAGQAQLAVGAGDPLYGIGGYSAFDTSDAGLLRTGTWMAQAGAQGHAGAPWVWSTAGWGVLFDTLGARFRVQHGQIRVDEFSKPDIDAFIVVGRPAALFAGLRTLSGAAPMFPKWAMGFTNSQWGIDEKQLLDIIATYRAKHIPIDNFTLDFDWKAWGQDDYGEFRWNAAKFPDGPDGKLKATLDREGLHLTGIMKPRIHVDTVEGHYASAHDFWFPGEKPAPDYFSHKPVADLDFDKPAVRAWFFNPTLQHSFETGIRGWWNDEADNTPDDTQFMNMQRALYDGQRAHFPERVWSINRDFYLGAQRYAYGLWSGDIPTGFASMAAQRVRMLSAIDVGAMRWGMDGGGFRGHPTPENYARWIEFGAFTPIFRVHGDHDEHRQPWVYGPVAEAAAVRAMRLRYALIPYIYSCEWGLHATGVGLVRPLTFAFPDDPRVRNDVSAWMFGDSLLVSPVVEPGQTVKRVYLPTGTWTDWFSGKVYAGGQTIELPVDATTWSDIPLFIRQGAIIPTQPAMDYVGQQALTTVTVDVFPAATRSSFDYYDDAGDSYAYEQGAYYLQVMAAQQHGRDVEIDLGGVRGSYRPALRSYLFNVHGLAATRVVRDGHVLARTGGLRSLQHATGEGWASGHDRYGAVTWLKLDAAQPQRLTLQPAS